MQWRYWHLKGLQVMDMMTLCPLAYPKACPHAWNGVFKRHCLLVLFCLASSNLQKFSTFSAIKCKFIIIERWSISLFMTFTKRNWELVLMKQILERKTKRIFTCLETSASFYLFCFVRNFFNLELFQTILKAISFCRSLQDLSNDAWIVEIWCRMRKLCLFEIWVKQWSLS